MSIVPSVRLELRHDPGSAVCRTQFTEALSHMAATVCIVSANTGEDRHGRTATAVVSLSAEPPTLLISVKSGSALAKAIATAGGFSLAMLAQGQELVADAFAGRVAAENRHLIGVWTEWPSGRPHLLGAIAAFDCEVSGAMSVADHELFVGSVIATEISGPSRPLMWGRRNYRALKDDDAGAEPDLPELPLLQAASVTDL